jgi:peptidoglycan hydrolase CwlO-like protein
MPPRNQFPKPIDEILVAMGTIHKKLDELLKDIDELKQVIKETQSKDTTYSRGWFWS